MGPAGQEEKGPLHSQHGTPVFTVSAVSTLCKPTPTPAATGFWATWAVECGQKKQNWEESWLPPHMGIFKAELLALGHLRLAWLGSREKPFGKLFNLTNGQRHQMKNYAKLPQSTCEWPSSEPHHSVDEDVGNRYS